MAKNERSIKPVRRQRTRKKTVTVETILRDIDSLPPDERRKLFARLEESPEWLYLIRSGWVAAETWWKAAVDLRMETRESVEKLEEELDSITDELTETQEELEDRIPKRQMDPANRETLREYQRLVKQYEKELAEKRGKTRGAKQKALETLVNLPGERAKHYVRVYRLSRQKDTQGIGDMEAVRQHVKRLQRTARGK